MRQEVNGVSLPRRLSSATELADGLTLRHLLFLLTLGAVGVVLHSAWDRGLGLPGHHGLEWMALLVIARSNSRFRWAATASCFGAAAISVLPLWGFGDPFMPLIYLLPGPIMDIVHRLAGRRQNSLWFTAILGGIAFATKPVARLAISTVLGWPYGSLLYGFAFPLASHLMFGVIGASLGLGLVKLARHKRADSI